MISVASCSELESCGLGLRVQLSTRARRDSMRHRCPVARGPIGARGPSDATLVTGGSRRQTGPMLIDVPDGKDPITYVWGELVPRIGPAAARFSGAVYDRTTLGLREFEAARLRIAQINGCVFCLDWRTERDGVKVEDEFADAVTEWRTTDAFDDRTRLAAEYAERYALDHHGLDDEFWTRMAEHYSQAEIVELTMSIGSWLAFGRLNHVLGIDKVCVLPSTLAGRG